MKTLAVLSLVFSIFSFIFLWTLVAPSLYRPNQFLKFKNNYKNSIHFKRIVNGVLGIFVLSAVALFFLRNNF